MSPIELRHIINEYLSHIEDVSFLNALKTIIESRVSEDVYKLNDYQKKRIVLAEDQIENEQTISHDELQKEIGQWLNSK